MRRRLSRVCKPPPHACCDTVLDDWRRAATRHAAPLLPPLSATAPGHSHRHPTAVAAAGLASIRTCAPARQQARPREPYSFHSNIRTHQTRGVHGPRPGSNEVGRAKPAGGRRQQPPWAACWAGHRARAASTGRARRRGARGPKRFSSLSARPPSHLLLAAVGVLLQAPAAPRRLNHALRCTPRAGAHAVDRPSPPPRAARRAARTGVAARERPSVSGVQRILVVSRTTIWASSAVGRLAGRVGDAGRTLRRI